ncbi:hypothetical protein GCM10011516_20080 [Sphingobacterium cellulitidis]|uniref:Uncharacterized protein n=2 Tax=Sphingobacterium cellulitidis TaxID=1768011 RepID=A0A8H9FZQ2_9SPHI|nr:hypothetical protein GCM10011516_20080 [Sphingobacterium soli]
MLLIIGLFILHLANFLVDLIMPIAFKHLWQFYKPIFFINLALSLAMSVQYLGYYPYVFMTAGYLSSAAIVRFFEGNTKYLFFNLGLTRKDLVLYTFIANLIISFVFILIFYYGFSR